LLDIYTPFFFVIGAVFGSFANVVVLRLPSNESLLTPSHCRKCQARISWADNIPIFSYIIRRGRCRQCGESFSPRYAIVEALMGALFLAAYLKLGMSWFLLEFLIFTFMAVTASVIDLDHFILPDVFTLGGLGIALVGAALNPERYFMDALIGFLAGGGLLYATAYLYFKIRGQEGMGGGDIKLLAWIGALLGWQAILFVVISSAVLGSLFGVARMIIAKKSLQEPIPFGPFLVAGALGLVYLDPPTMVQWLGSLYGFP